MTKKEAIQILWDRYDQIKGLASVMSSLRFDWVGSVLKAVMSGVPEAISTLESEGEEE